MQKQLKYNLAQLLFLASTVKVRVLEWGRGTGKSTILAKYIIDCVTQMPRSSGAIVACTYVQIKTRTLISTIDGLAQHGYHEGVHFMVGKKPPRKLKWAEPYQPPLDYKNCIIFWNGTILHFITQDASGASGRGLNIDWGFADEAALLDEELFETDFVLTLRSNKERVASYPDGTWRLFKDCPLHHSMVLASSTPVTAKGRWFLKYEQLATLHPDQYFFLSADARWNLHNLGRGLFKKAKEILTDFMFNAEVLNIRVPQIENGFYPKLSESLHTYNKYGVDYFAKMMGGGIVDSSGDKDVDPNGVLIAGIDWGTSINCMVIAQGNRHSLNFVKNLYVKFPKIVNDLCDEFVRYYKPHKKKVLHLWYDPTGNLHTANSRTTLAKQVKARLEEQGWQVSLMTQGTVNELHENKYHLWNNILTEDKTKSFPVIRFNRTNCNELWISMNNAPAKIGQNEAIKKDKGSERNKRIQQEFATHFSDAADLVIVGMYKPLLFSAGQQASAPIMM